MEFTKDKLIALVNQYNLGQFKSVELIETSGNNSFLITTDQDKYFLRLCGDVHRHRSKEEIDGELDLIDKLLVNNFPVIGYEKTKIGERVVCFENYNGYLRKYLAGEFVRGNPNEEQLNLVGKTLGQYHNLVADFTADNKRQKIDFGLAETKLYFEEQKKEILSSNFPQAEKFIKVFEQEINELAFPEDLAKGMIHEDLGKRHVIWQGGKIATIIDFDRSYFGPLVLDLGQALRGWCFKDNWQAWSTENAGIFLQGYERERKLSDLEKEYLMPAIIFAILERALSFCTNTIYRKQPDPADEEFALESLFEQINKIKI